MSEFNQPADLGPFEARLAELLPSATEVDRDEVLFEAGRQAAQRDHKRSLRKWHAMCGTLCCFVIGQWVWLPGFWQAHSVPTDPPIAEQRQQPDKPTPNNTEVTPQPVLVQQASPDNTPQPLLPGEEDDTATIAMAAPRQPSLWSNLFPSAVPGSPVIAWQRELSVGSSRKGTLHIPRLSPKPGNMSSQSGPTLTSMRRDWSPE